MTSSLLTQLMTYFESLDWNYLITFILLAYAFNSNGFTRWISENIGLHLKTRYRTAIVGLSFGAFLYYLRGQDPATLESLFSTFVFTMIFHQLLIDQLVKKINNWVSGNSDNQEPPTPKNPAFS